MRKALTMSLAIIIEASLFVLADLIARRRRRNGSFTGLHRGFFGRFDGLRGADQSLHSWGDMRRARTYRRFIS